MLDDALRSALLGVVPALVAKVREELGQPRMVPIKAALVPYRTILTAEKLGELRVYRVGGGRAASSFVDEAELFDWIKRSGAKGAPNGGDIGANTDAAKDELDRVIELGDARRKRRSA